MPCALVPAKMHLLTFIRGGGGLSSVFVQVAVNGKHTLIYAHRISLEKIDTLGIYGKVIIHSVGFSFSSVSPLPWGDGRGSLVMFS